MKAINLDIIITSIRSRKDKSAGFSAETPELTDGEFAVFRGLQGLTLKALFQPEAVTETLVIETDLASKSQSQRLRSVIALYCKKLERGEESDKLYYREMERLIDKYKELLD